MWRCHQSQMEYIKHLHNESISSHTSKHFTPIIEHAYWSTMEGCMYTRLHHITVLFTHIIIVTTRLLQSKKDPKPYHASILTGQGWVEELLSGHPKHIHCELGVCRHTFLELIGVLQELSYGHSKHITLEEQLTIFLYISVTGLTIWHVGECFQWSNETISHYFHHIPSIMSSHPFFTRHVVLPTPATPMPDIIHYNPRFWPWLWGALGALDGGHFNISPSLQRALKLPQPQRLPLHELPICMHIWFSLCLCIYRLGRLCD